MPAYTVTRGLNPGSRCVGLNREAICAWVEIVTSSRTGWPDPRCSRGALVGSLQPSFSWSNTTAGGSFDADRSHQDLILAASTSMATAPLRYGITSPFDPGLSGYWGSSGTTFLPYSLTQLFSSAFAGGVGLPLSMKIHRTCFFLQIPIPTTSKPEALKLSQSRALRPSKIKGCIIRVLIFAQSSSLNCGHSVHRINASAPLATS